MENKFLARQGSSTLEFILCAPALLILMYVAMEINERIEQRTTATIAAGNASWLADPNSVGAASSDLKTTSKSDILGTKSNPASGLIGPQAGGVNATLDNNTVMAYSSDKMTQDAYGLEIIRTVSVDSNTRAKERSQVKIGNLSTDATAMNLNNTLNSVASVLDTIQNTGVDFIPRLFPDATPVEQQVLSWSLKDGGSTNAALKAISELSKITSSTAGNDLAHFSEDSAKVLAAKSTFLRRDPMFHPSGYMNQQLYGMLFGAMSTEMDEFNDKCFMNIDDKNVCGQSNGFVNYLKAGHTSVTLLRTWIQCVPKGPVFTWPAEIEAGIAIGVALDVAVNTATGGVKDDIVGPIQNEVQDKIDAAYGRVQKEIDKAKNGLGADVEKQIKQVFTDLGAPP